MPLCLLSAALCCGAQGNPGVMSVPTLTLRDALEIAQRNNRQIGIARLQIDQAGHKIAEARTSLLPQLNVLAQGGYLLDKVNAHFSKGILGTVNGSLVPSQDTDIVSGNRFTALYDLSLAQPLTQIPRIRVGIRLQEIGRNLAEEQERQQRQTIASNVRQVYFGLLQTQEAVKATNANLQALHELERTVTDQVVQQAALRADLLEVQARAAAQETTLSLQLDTLAQYKEQMNILLGRDVQTPFQVAPATEVVPVESDRDRLQAQAARNRPDLRRSALQIRQAELDRRNTQLSYLPDVSLATNYAALGGSINGLPDHLWTIGFQLSWQPFEWGKRRHDIAEKTDAVKQAQLALQEAQAGAQLDVDNRIRQERQARQQQRAAQAAQRAARERLRVTLNQYQVKATLLKDVLQAQAALTDADRQVRDADLAALTAQAELRRASGEE